MEDGTREPLDPRHPLPNRDLDTGRVVQPGGYSLTDATYARLLHMLTRQPNLPIPPESRRRSKPITRIPMRHHDKKRPSAMAQVQADLGTLATMHTSAQAPPFPTYDDAPKTGRKIPRHNLNSPASVHPRLVPDPSSVPGVPSDSPRRWGG